MLDLDLVGIPVKIGLKLISMKKSYLGNIFLSQRKLAFRRVLVGGFIATILWEILKHLFGVYIVRIKLYSIIYGSIGSLILLMLWLYYSILVYLIGAEIAMELD